ncbi:MAG: hypothetical protein GYA56_02125 [Geobacteraceae bacterium]|jgi:hypothetical protein|nr:hypothetical protein [Geobacteraceae bacterium]OPX97547.1 MAG: hypothetical protein A4E60_03229 [Syntrophorhabdus sp. PtaB.Bin047]
MDEITNISVEDFQRQPDGSWVAIRTSDVQSKTGKVIRIPPGMSFRKGGKLVGFDIAEALDRVGLR